jgi:hypothetical protein
MGQAKQRKAEIEQLKATAPKFKWSELRPFFVEKVKQSQDEYMAKLIAADNDNILAVMKSADQERLNFAVRAGLGLVVSKIATVEQIKNACWEGYNGLLEASCVAMNIQEQLGLPVDELDFNQFVITGDNALEQAVERGWLNK